MQKYIVITQYINGDWVELTQMDIERNTPDDEIEKGIEDIKDIIFDADKINFVNETGCVIFNRKDGPIKIRVDEDKNG